MVEDIVIWGYYGSNYGDNIMMLKILQHVIQSNIWKNIYIIPYDNHVEEILPKNDKLKIIYPEYKGKINKILWLLSLPHNALHIWGGGTIFTDQEGDGNAAAFLFLKMLGAKFAYLSCGIGKLTNKERIRKVKALLKLSTFCALRDINSYNVARKISPLSNVFLTDDMVILYAQEIKILNFKSNQLGKYLLVSWRNLENYTSKDFENEQMIRAAQTITELCLKKNIGKIIILPLDNTEDIDCSYSLKRMLHGNFDCQIISEYDINKITAIIANAELYISGRLHGCIIGEKLNVLTFALGYSPKMEGFYSEIHSKRHIDILNEQFPNCDKLLQLMEGKKTEPYFDWKDHAKLAEFNLKLIDEVRNGKI